MKLIGILGPIGSGKGTAADYISDKYGYEHITMGNILREFARKKHVKPKRINLLRLQQKYRKKFGNDFFINIAIEKAKTFDKTVIDGVRNPIDARRVHENRGKLVLVDADPEVRFERMKKRRRAGFSKTFEQFRKEEANEHKYHDFKTTMKYADYKVDNTDGKVYLFKQIDKLMKKLR
jgi:dephospho-CoA kinase